MSKWPYLQDDSTKYSRRANFYENKEEESNKEHIICYECKQSRHIKINCPKLRKDKKSSKEKFKKFNKVFAAWGESDIDTSDDESSDQEVANLCLVAK